MPELHDDSLSDMDSQTLEIANRWLTLRFDLAAGTYAVSPVEGMDAGVGITAIEAQADLRVGPKQVIARSSDADVVAAGVDEITWLASPAHRLSVEFGIRNVAAHLRFEALLPHDRPAMVVRLSIFDEHPVDIGRSQPAIVSQLAPLVTTNGGSLQLGGDGELSFYKHGWQSWSYCGTLHASDRDRGTRLGPLARPVHTNPSTPVGRRRGHFWSEGFGIVSQGTRATAKPRRAWSVVLGFITLATQITLLEVDLRRRSSRLFSLPEAALPEGGSVSSEWAYLEFVAPDMWGQGPEEADILARYADTVAEIMQARAPLKAPTGWCSWYELYDRVAERDVVENLAVAENMKPILPLDRIQIDDGWQESVGDWWPNAKFPNGMDTLAQTIERAGFRPGLWMAPFVVDPRSRLVSQHPDWILRDRRSRPVSAGFIFNRFCLVLDVTHPEVDAWLHDLVSRAVRQWGYDYLKLDFLYAAALPGQRYRSERSRLGALRAALETIRDAAGERTFLLGCGCPIGPAIGVIDAMRIGPDVDSVWQPRFPGSWLPGMRSESGMPSARNAIRNILARSFTHRRWFWNDPDCLLLRAHDSELGVGELQALASVIGLSGGALLLSDDLTRLEPERISLASALLPTLDGSAVPCDLLDREIPELYALTLKRPWESWIVAGLFNWAEKAHHKTLTPRELGGTGEHHVYDFWNRRYARVGEDERLITEQLAPHNGQVLAIRTVRDTPQLVGSTFHITVGGEIARWDVGDRELDLEISIGRQAEGEILLYLPRAVAPQAVGSPSVTIRQVEENVWCARLAVNGRTPLRITW